MNGNELEVVLEVTDGYEQRFTEACLEVLKGRVDDEKQKPDSWMETLRECG